MSMTKKETAEVESLRRELSIVAALRWTEQVLPDIPVPVRNRLTKGWLAGYDRVDIACSSCVFHAYGRNDKTTTQQPVALFSTKLLALKALRYEMERRFAEQLANIDRQIAESLAEPRPAEEAEEE